MAAGRHGGYRDKEFRGLEPNIDISRRGISHSNGEYDRIRNGDRHFDGSWVLDRGLKDRLRFGQKDVKERDIINGGYRSASSRSDSGTNSGVGDPRLGGFSVRAVDREPGELSSESGSDDATDSESWVKVQNEDSKAENGTGSPVVSKRKFSPIIWDRDDKELSNTSKSRISPITTSLPLPPLRRLYHQSPTIILNGDAQNSPVRDSNPLGSEPLLPNPPVELGSHVAAVSESPVDLSSSSHQEKQWHNIQEMEHLEDDVYVPTRNISASRWADDGNFPADEGQFFYDDEMPKRRKKIHLSETVEVSIQSKSLTSPGEVEGESSERTRLRSSESDEVGLCVRSSSCDAYPANYSDKNDHTEIDKECNKNSTSGSDSDTDSKGEHGSRDTPEPSVPPQRNVNMLKGCRSVEEFERLNKIDEGTYGVVYRAKDKKTGEVVALKKVKMEKEREGFPLTSLREINILLSFHHSSVVDVKEVVVGSNLDSIFMVMEYMEHDLKGLMETMKQPFTQSEVKCLMIQLLEGVKYLHENWVLHRDLKTSNLLLNNRGELKICDFGLSRQYGSPSKPYTHLVVTLWYRAPELLLGAKQYSTAIDMWSLGCIMAELLSKGPLFNGKTEFDQLDKIFKTLGTPNETIWPGLSKLPGVKVNYVKQQYNLLRKKFPATSFTGSPVLSDAGFDLLNKLLTYDPEKRITAADALKHEWFREVPLPKSREFMPTFPAQHAQDRRLRRIMKSPDPLEELRRKELQQGELGTGGLFG